LRKALLEILKLFFCSPVAFAVLEKIFKDLASFHGFSLPVQKIIRISEPFKQIIKRPTQGTFTFMPKISFLGIIVSEKILKEMLTRMSCHDIRSE
jgi:hypothetical protein